MDKTVFYKIEYSSPLGKLTICAKNNHLVGLWIEGQKYFANTVNVEMISEDSLEIFKKTKKWLDEYFKGNRPNIKYLNLSPIGNEFRQSVWKILCKIPYGEVITYGDIAKELAKQKGIERMSAQAVGGAVGHNPISIIIPCHRVIGKNGKLTGYAGGLNAKKYLLNLENADIKY